MVARPGAKSRATTGGPNPTRPATTPTTTTRPNPRAEIGPFNVATKRPPPPRNSVVRDITTSIARTAAMLVPQLYPHVGPEPIAPLAGRFLRTYNPFSGPTLKPPLVPTAELVRPPLGPIEFQQVRAVACRNLMENALMLAYSTQRPPMAPLQRIARSNDLVTNLTHPTNFLRTWQETRNVQNAMERAKALWRSAFDDKVGRTFNPAQYTAEVNDLVASSIILLDELWQKYTTVRDSVFVNRPDNFLQGSTVFETHTRGAALIRLWMDELMTTTSDAYALAMCYVNTAINNARDQEIQDWLNSYSPMRRENEFYTRPTFVAPPTPS